MNGTETEMHKNEGMWKWEGVPLGDDWSKPDPFHLSYGNHRWIKFYEQLNSHTHNSQIRLEYGRYICREWNARHSLGAQVYEFKIWWLSEFQVIDGTTEPREKELLWYGISVPQVVSLTYIYILSSNLRHHICMDNKPIWPPPEPVQQPGTVEH